MVLSCMLIPCMMSGCLAWRRGGNMPDSLSASHRLTRQGLAAMEAGDWTEAEVRLREALDRAPHDAAIQQHLAETLYRRGAREEALKHMIAAAAAAPQDASIAVRTSEMLLEADRAEEAAKLADHAVKLNPDLADAWAARGRSRARLGLNGEAQANFQRALLLAPNSSPVLIESARLYSEHGEYERALTTVHRLIDTFPPGEEPCEALVLEGRTYLALGRPQQAESVLADASSRYPATAEMTYLRAEAELAQGRPVPAQQFAREALALDGKFAPAHDILGRLARDEGEQLRR
jgi:tetratricopeptide (TPR) repeat protein